jgi:hypothetical protein
MHLLNAEIKSLLRSRLCGGMVCMSVTEHTNITGVAGSFEKPYILNDTKRVRVLVKMWLCLNFHEMEF